MPKGFSWLIFAQFLSGLADNALLLVGVYFLQEQAYPGWWVPLLKFAFTLSYVILANAVGPLSDAFAKRHVMSVMTLFKIMAIVLLLLGANPLWVFAMTGLAASLYAPAKYGLIIETVDAPRLVQANAWMEVSVVLSVVGGAVLGGWLLGVGMDGADIKDVMGLQTWPQCLVETKMIIPLALVCLIYVLSALSNLGIMAKQSKAQQPLIWRDAQWTSFMRNNRQLWTDALGGLSLRVTTLCWGVGAVLQFVVLVWAKTNAGMSLQEGAYLQGLVALGAIVGAVVAATQRKGTKLRQLLPWALLLAVLMPCLAITNDVHVALPILVMAGFSGGRLLIPMNAVLQRRGKKCMTPGRSIAVQGFNENLSVLIMLGFYSLLLSWDWPLLLVMIFLSLPLWFACMPWLMSFKRAASNA